MTTEPGIIEERMTPVPTPMKKRPNPPFLFLFCMAIPFHFILCRGIHKRAFFSI